MPDFFFFNLKRMFLYFCACPCLFLRKNISQIFQIFRYFFRIHLYPCSLQPNAPQNTWVLSLQPYQRNALTKVGVCCYPVGAQHLKVIDQLTCNAFSGCRAHELVATKFPTKIFHSDFPFRTINHYYYYYYYSYLRKVPYTRGFFNLKIK